MKCGKEFEYRASDYCSIKCHEEALGKKVNI